MKKILLLILAMASLSAGAQWIQKVNPRTGRWDMVTDTAAITNRSGWTTATGKIYQTDISKKVGIGTQDPEYSLDIKGIQDSVIQDGSANNGLDIPISHAYEAFKFTASSSYTAGPTVLYVKKDAGVDDNTGYITKWIYTDNAGVPGTVIGTVNEPRFYGHMTTSYTEFPTQCGGPSLANGTSYWIVVKRPYVPQGGNVYIQGKATGTDTYAYSTDGASWTTQDTTAAYKIMYHSNQTLDIYNQHFYGGWIESLTEYALYLKSTYDNALTCEGINRPGIVTESPYNHGINAHSYYNYSGYFQSDHNASTFHYGPKNFGLIAQTDSADFASVYGLTVPGIGLYGKSTSNYGIKAETYSGPASLYCYSPAGYPGLRSWINTSSINTTATNIDIMTASQGTTAAGFGGSIDFHNENADGSMVKMGSIAVKSLKTTAGQERGSLSFMILGSSGYDERMRIDSAGNVTLTGKLNYIDLPTCTSLVGYIMSNGTRYIHNWGTANFYAGYGSGNFDLTGINSTGVGYTALTRQSSGNGNTAFGAYAGAYTTTNGENVFLGAYSGWYNTAKRNTYTGYQAGNGSEGNATGDQNTFNGFQAGLYIRNGENNVGIGAQALFSTSGAGLTGNGNIAIGYRSQYSATTAANNVSIGFQSLYSNSTGAGNVAIGYQAGYNETGSNKLYIDNSNTATPLIGGDFSTDAVTITGSCSITTFLILTPTADPPGSPAEGMVYADTDHHLYFYNGTTWVQLDN